MTKNAINWFLFIRVQDITYSDTKRPYFVTKDKNKFEY